jgi:hypothetical protein
MQSFIDLWRGIIPFKKEPIKAAIGQFDHNNPPSTSVSFYRREAYQKWGLM